MIIRIEKIPIWFQYKYYLSIYNDLKALSKTGDVSELEAYSHWNLYGRNEGRKCFFLTNKVLDKFKKNAIIKIIGHYSSNKIHIFNKSLKINFDFKYYLKKYKDLKFTDKSEAFNHYLNYGIKEKRICINFHWKLYCITYKLKYNNDFDALLHYLKIGYYLFYNPFIIKNDEHNIKYEKEYQEIINEERIARNKIIFSFLKNDIAILASYPDGRNLVYLHTLKSISKYFKKIYFIYSVKNLDFSNQLKFDNIEIIYTENIGYDFKKYLIGMKNIKQNNEKFNKLWLINDSFLIHDWKNNFLTYQNLNIIYNNDMVGTFEGYCDGLKHLQSFLLILSTEISEFYYNKLSKSKFLKMKITNEKKNHYIVGLEVKLCNELIKSGLYKIKSLYDFCGPTEINNILRSYNFDRKINFKNELHNNQSLWIGPFKNIFKTGYIHKYLSIDVFLKKNVENNNFEANLNIYFHIYQPFVNYYNFFYNKKLYIKNTKNYSRISNLILLNKIIKMLPYYENIEKKYNIKNKLKILIENKISKNVVKLQSKILDIKEEDIIDSLFLINYIKKYKYEYENKSEDTNTFLTNLGNYFYKKGCHTTIEKLKKDIINHQKITKNKKVVYTNNLNSYDTFWDIDNDLVENDTDYIYISNVYDENVCNNFKFIYCNLNSNDIFYNNRFIKFNKKLFDCYDKVLYIDANVKINKKLSNFFDLLTKNIDLVLNSHPERKFLGDEVNFVKSTSNNSWNLTKENIDNFINQQLSSFKNDLYWLNVQLTNTKHNIFEDIYELYKKYKFTRDQIYFPCIQSKYKIKKIDIKANFELHDDPNILDGDYGYIKVFSEYFCRPFGGKHI